MLQLQGDPASNRVLRVTIKEINQKRREEPISTSHKNCMIFRFSSGMLGKNSVYTRRSLRSAFQLIQNIILSKRQGKYKVMI